MPLPPLRVLPVTPFDPYAHFNKRTFVPEYDDARRVRHRHPQYRLDARQRLPVSLQPLLFDVRPARRPLAGRGTRRPDRGPTVVERHRNGEPRRQRAAVHQRRERRAQPAAVHRPSAARCGHRRRPHHGRHHPGGTAAALSGGARAAQRRRRQPGQPVRRGAQHEPRRTHLPGSAACARDLPRSTASSAR